jgi:gluconate 2-dehydrogenase gamma chain
MRTVHATDPDRRRLLLGAAAALGAATGLPWTALAAAAQHAHAAVSSPPPAGFEFLGADEARTVAAIADCIVPGGATPGASDAGVVYFVDHVHRHGSADRAAAFRAALAAFSAGHAGVHPGSAGFADQDLPARTAYLRQVDTTPFFATMRLLTLAGLLSLPQYGGNRDKLGWRLVGFVDQHAWEPPFGHYDRDYAGFVPYPPRGSERPE